MSTLKNYIEIEYQKVMVNDLLKQVFVNIPEEEYSEYAELVVDKLYTFRKLRETVRNMTVNDGKTAETAKELGVTEDDMLDAFIYMIMVVENVHLLKQLEKAYEDTDE